MEKKKVIVYVDGFNFYYGLKKDPKWRKYYWLDIVALFEKFMKPNQELVAVKYFSARPDDPEACTNQGRFFQANKENSKFHLILGTYLKKSITCRKCGYEIKTHEEKETDVRIATQIVVDAYERNYDIAIIVSADSDMVPAIEIAKGIGRTVFVYFPPNQHSSNLTTMGSGSPIFLQRYESRFRQSILPDTVHLQTIDIDISIPDKWKRFQGRLVKNEFRPDEGIRMVLDMVKREYVAQQMEGSQKNNYALVGFGANHTIYNGKPYEYPAKMVEELQGIITQLGGMLMNTNVRQEPQTAERSPLCYGEDMVSKFKVLGKVIKLPYLFVNVLGKTIGYQKLHLSMKSETKYYNRFTDAELEMINEGIHVIGTKLLNTHLQMVKD